MSVRILEGDALTVLRTLPDCSVQCCVTSPPYFGLRDYGVSGQLGLEKTPQLYVDAMVGVFSEVKRALRDDGTLWLNIGDSYCASPKGSLAGQDKSGLTSTRTQENAPVGIDKSRIVGVKPKDLIGVPWMLAFALRADGWYLRSDIIWHKPNPMPESVTDRPTKCHEYLFLLTKSAAYYYDADAIAEPVAASQLGRVRADPVGGTSHAERGQHSAGGVYRTNGKHSTQDRQSAGRRIVENVAKARAEGADHDNPFGTTRNARSVWSVTTLPYAEAHFATFPPKLIEPCIRAGSAKGQTVLDPFGGAGTTGLVADRLGRDALLIELNPVYAEMARRRIRLDNPFFTDVA